MHWVPLICYWAVKDFFDCFEGDERLFSDSQYSLYCIMGLVFDISSSRNKSNMQIGGIETIKMMR